MKLKALLVRLGQAIIFNYAAQLRYGAPVLAPTCSPGIPTYISRGVRSQRLHPSASLELCPITSLGTSFQLLSLASGAAVRSSTRGLCTVYVHLINDV